MKKIKQRVSKRQLKVIAQRAIQERNSHFFISKPNAKNAPLGPIIKSQFESAVRQGDYPSARFIRETTGIGFQSGNLLAALRNQNQPLLDWLLQTSSDNELKRMMTLQSLIMAVIHKMKPLAYQMVSNGALTRSHHNRKRKPLIEYACRTGNIEVIDLAMALTPQDISPKMYGYVLSAACRPSHYTGHQFDRIQNPAPIFQWLKERGVPLRNKDIEAIFEPHLLGQILDSNGGLYQDYILDLLKIGAPYDRFYFIKARRTIHKDSNAESIERALSNQLGAYEFFLDIRDFEDSETYFNLDNLTKRVKEMGIGNPLKDRLITFIDEMRQSYALDSFDDDFVGGHERRVMLRACP